MSSRRRCFAIFAALLALTLAACGGTGKPIASSGATATVQITSSSCTEVPGTNAQCEFILSDGRRFGCPGDQFTGVKVTLAMLTRSRRCIPLARLPVPRAVRAIAARIDAVRACLGAKGVRATGGPVFPAPSTDYRGPGGELVVAPTTRASVAGMSFIAFYTDASSARRLEPDVVANARRIHAEVERRGAVTILLIRPIGAARRSAVRACALSG